MDPSRLLSEFKSERHSEWEEVLSDSTTDR